MIRRFHLGLAWSLSILAVTAAEAQLPVIYPTTALPTHEPAVHRTTNQVQPSDQGTSNSKDIPIIDPTHLVEWTKRAMDSIGDHRRDPSLIERFVLVVGPLKAGRDYEMSFDGHAGFLDIVQPCLDSSLVPLSWSTARTSRQTVDETRYRATPTQAASFASCIGQNAASTEG